jgi:hypothetical protein
LQNLNLTDIGYADATNLIEDIPNLLIAKLKYQKGSMRQFQVSSGVQPNLHTRVTTYLASFGYKITGTFSLIYDSLTFPNSSLASGFFKVTFQNNATAFIDFIIPFNNGALQNPIGFTQNYPLSTSNADLNTLTSTGNYYCTGTKTNVPNGASGVNGLCSVEVATISGEDRYLTQFYKPITQTDNGSVLYMRRGYKINKNGTPNAGGYYTPWVIIGGQTTLFENDATPIRSANIASVVVPNISVYEKIMIQYSPSNSKQFNLELRKQASDQRFMGTLDYHDGLGIRYLIGVELGYDPVTNKCNYSRQDAVRFERGTGTTQFSDVTSGLLITRIYGKEI